MKADSTLHYLRVDDGPAIGVRPDQRVTTVEVVNGKTGKNAGTVSLYRTDQVVVIHSVDNRRPMAEVRKAWVFDRQTPTGDMLTHLPKGYEYREVLRRAGYKASEVAVDINDLVVSAGGTHGKN